jgi:hypothetical protein
MRLWCVLSSVAVLAVPALAAAQSESWIELPVNQADVRGWYDVGTIHVQGPLRTTRIRFQPPGAAQPNEGLIRVNCQTGATQSIAGFNDFGEPVAGGDWSVVPGSIGWMV